MPDQAVQRQLLCVARRSIAAGLEGATGPTAGESASCADESGGLLPPQANFVTLTLDGTLRGCIGTLERPQNLILSVADNAYRAAFHDPRFAALNRDEFEHARIEISLLSEPEPLSAPTEQVLLDSLLPGRDGLILEYGRKRATFLPAVWEQLAEPIHFLAELKRKAGLSPAFWSGELRVYRYGAVKFTEPAEGVSSTH